jgi:hypothetical protein
MALHWMVPYIARISRPRQRTFLWAGNRIDIAALPPEFAEGMKVRDVKVIGVAYWNVAQRAR